MLTDVVWAILLLLATWRYTVMLMNEGGPWNVLDLVRRAANKTGLGELFLCPWCLSVWVGAALMQTTISFPSVGVFLIGVGALSAGVVLLHYVFRNITVGFIPSDWF